MPKSKEYRAFEKLTDRVLSVSKETVDKRIAAYEQEREKTPRQMRPGRNPKPRHDHDGEK